MTIETAERSGRVVRAIDIAKAKGAKRAVELPVSVPAHSSLMHSAGARLGQTPGEDRDPARRESVT